MKKLPKNLAASVSSDTQPPVAESVPYNEPLGTDPVLYCLVVDSLTEYAVFAVSPNGIVLSWYAGAEKTFGYSAMEMIGWPFDILFTADDVQRGIPKDELATALSGKNTHHDRWFVRKDQTRFWGTNTVQPIHDPARVLIGFTKLVRDSTPSHVALEALSDSEQQLRLLVESVSDYAIFSIELDGTIKSWNAGGEKVFGYTQAEIVGHDFSMLFSAEDTAAGIPLAELRKATVHGVASVERWLVRKDGSRFLASGKLSQLKRDPAGEVRGFVKIVHDITENFVAAQDLRHQAEYDDLTELPNRRLFYERVQRAIALMRGRRSQRFAVLFVDLDHFKAVNDVFGHAVADQLLAMTARRLEKCVRTGDVVARIGGDEFAILLNNIGGVPDARDAAERIRVEMLKSAIIDDREVAATVSIGIAIAEPKHNLPDDILRDADAAMYTAKAEGRARSAIFTTSITTLETVSADLVVDVDRAIERS